jgi:UDP-glucuronate 4-epimerase
MALQKFTKAILAGEPIKVFNYGRHRRDFTYIDDIIDGVIRVLDQPAVGKADWNSESPDASSSSAPYKICNIGNNNPVELLDYIKCLEECLGKEAQKEMLPMQPGDVRGTYADVDSLIEDFDYRPSKNIHDGIKSFTDWYLDYYL